MKKIKGIVLVLGIFSFALSSCSGSGVSAGGQTTEVAVITVTGYGQVYVVPDIWVTLILAFAHRVQQ